MNQYEPEADPRAARPRPWETDALLAAIVEIAADAVISVDRHHRIRLFNRGAEEIFGYTAAEVLGGPLDRLLPPTVAKGHSDHLARFSRSGVTARRMGQRAEVRGMRADGSEFPAEASISHTVVDGEPVYTAILRDVSEQRAVERALREAESRRQVQATEAQMAAIVASSEDAIVGMTLDGTITTWNRGAQTIFGYRADEVVGRSAVMLMSPVDASEVEDFLRRLVNGEPVIRMETVRRRKNGSIVDVALTISPVLDGSGTVTGASSIARDITGRKLAEAKLKHQALHDALTGLPNRALLQDRLDQALARCQRDSHEELLVAFLDLDHFKVINDSLGHAAGDDVLLAAAQRLREAVRPSDTVARFGGDEFVVVCEGASRTHGDALGRRIAEVLEAPIAVSGRSVVASASVGFAVGGAGDTAEMLLANADAAMYRAKARGRSRTEAFAAEFRHEIDRRLSMEAALRRAIDAEQFYVEYQPIISLDDGVVVGAEALVRWRAPDPAWCRPDAFIPVAEETGLIVPIGSWVLGEVVRQLGEWRTLLDANPEFSVSVNLSALQLTPALADLTFDLRNRGIEAGRLTFELTETVLMEDAETSIEALLGLKLLGVRLAVDDFGTGYSSLAYLQRLPVDTVKIDRAFIKGLGRMSNDSAIVAAILALADALELTVTAEGVETCDHLAALTALGCKQGQGFYWSPPVAPAEFAASFGSACTVDPVTS
jgi:diguanylate cyclase (GGDEF)-like protein/PAS domain S-box-containing protein